MTAPAAAIFACWTAAYWRWSKVSRRTIRRPGRGWVRVTVSGSRIGGAAGGVASGRGAAVSATVRPPPWRMPGGGGRSATSTPPRGAEVSPRLGRAGKRFGGGVAFHRQDFQADPGDAVRRDAQQDRGAAGDFDQAVRVAGAAVVDPDRGFAGRSRGWSRGRWREAGCSGWAAARAVWSNSSPSVVRRGGLSLVTAARPVSSRS